MSDYDAQQQAFDEWLTTAISSPNGEPTLWTAFQAGFETCRDQLRREIHARFKITPESNAAARAQIHAARKPLHCEDIAYNLAPKATAALAHVIGGQSESRDRAEGEDCDARNCLSQSECCGHGEGCGDCESQAAECGVGADVVSADIGHDTPRRGVLRRFRVKDYGNAGNGSHEVMFVETDGERVLSTLGNGEVSDITGLFSVQDCISYTECGLFEELPQLAPTSETTQ